MLATIAFMASVEPPFFLVERGEPKTVIVLPDKADSADKRAADILQSSVQKMSGATLPILVRSSPSPGEIDVGFPFAMLPDHLKASKPLVEDGFFVATTAQNLYVVSGGRKGAIYGVVDILEKYFGCRKFSPSAELFPKRSTLSIGSLAYADNPVNSFRCVNGEFSADQDYLDWSRLNSVDELYANGYYVHTFNKLVPPGTYFASHPEYYALVDGKRHSEQLCPSNPDLPGIIENKLKDEMALQPGKDVWGVSQNDNDTYCQDPVCRQIIEEEGSPAGPIIRLINKVAAEFPNKTIATLAYQFSRPAPKLTKPASNVMVMLCTIELNRSKPIEVDPASKDFVKDITDWGKICRNIYLWDYTVNFSHSLSPFPNLHILQPNIQFFCRNGVRKLFQQTNTSPGHEFSELKSYLIARLLWNPDANADAVIDDFLKGYYGAAAPFLRHYIASMEEALKRSGARLDIYESPTVHMSDYLSAGQVDEYNRNFDKAEAAVSGNTEFLARVKTDRLSLDYAMLEIAWSDPFGPRGYFDRTSNGGTPKPAMASLLEDFHTTCVQNGVKFLNESRMTPEQYYKACKQLVDLQIKGNLAFGKTVVATPPPSPKYGNGDISLLTNGIRGGSDFRTQWLGWVGTDFDLNLDLGSATSAHEASLDTIYVPTSWILHPSKVTCSVSTDGSSFAEVGTEDVGDVQRNEGLIRTFLFRWKTDGVRFVRFHVQAVKGLPAWHTAAGGVPWVFVDEVIVKREA